MGAQAQSTNDDDGFGPQPPSEEGYYEFGSDQHAPSPTPSPSPSEPRGHDYSQDNPTRSTARYTGNGYGDGDDDDDGDGDGEFTRDSDHAESTANPGKLKIFVGGLAGTVTDDDLYHYFQTFGVVTKAVVMLEHLTGRSRRFGFVTFADRSAVEVVLSTHHTIHGKAFVVQPNLSKRGYQGPKQGAGLHATAGPSTGAEVKANPRPHKAQQFTVTLNHGPNANAGSRPPVGRSRAHQPSTSFQSLQPAPKKVRAGFTVTLDGSGRGAGGNKGSARNGNRGGTNS